MPAAARIVTATPKNRSGVIAAKKPVIQVKKPTCGLNSRALTPAETTPMKMKARINRPVRKLCISTSHDFAFQDLQPFRTCNLSELATFQDLQPFRTCMADAV